MQSDRFLFLLTVILITTGILASYSLSVYVVHAQSLSPGHFLFRQMFYGFLGIAVIWGLSRLDPDKWLRPIGFGLFGFFFLLMFVMYFLPESIVPTINGAKRWIRLGPVSLTPVDFFKVGFVFFLAWSLTRKFYLPEEKFSFAKEIKLIIPYGLIFLVAVGLVAVIQNDFGQVFILGATMTMMIFLAGSSIKLFLFLVSTSSLAGVVLILMESHRIIRVKQWWAGAQEMILSFFPESVASVFRIEDQTVDLSYQVAQSLHAIHNGGIFGTGIGMGTVKLGYLSDVHTDFVLAGIAEEAGLVGVLFVALSTLTLVYRILRIANRSANPVYYLFCMGVALMLSVQFLTNALGIINLIPLKGITVPFISSGGSSLLAYAMAIGMVMMISRKARL